MLGSHAAGHPLQAGAKDENKKGFVAEHSANEDLQACLYAMQRICTMPHVQQRCGRLQVDRNADCS